MLTTLPEAYEQIQFRPSSQKSFGEEGLINIYIDRLFLMIIYNVLQRSIAAPIAMSIL